MTAATILVRGARQLLTLQGPAAPRRGAAMRELGVTHDGAVFIRGGFIDEVGSSRRMENLDAARDAQEINAAGRVVMPGFVDCHNHLFDTPEAATHSVRTASGKRLAARARSLAHGFLRHGTTTFEAKVCCGAEEALELKLMRVLAAVDAAPADVAVSHLVTRQYPRPAFLDKIRRKNLARFVDVLCRDGFDLEPLRRYLRQARELEFLAKLHAEGTQTAGVVPLALEAAAVSVDHLEGIGAEEVALLARPDVIATLLPAHSFHQGGIFAPARALIDSGAAVALGSDFHPARRSTCSMQAVVALACTQMGMTAEEAITAATINSAHAMRLAGRIGSLELGKCADLIVLNASDYREIGSQFGTNQVHLVIKRGVVVYREGEISVPRRRS